MSTWRHPSSTAPTPRFLQLDIRRWTVPVPQVEEKQEPVQEEKRDRALEQEQLAHELTVDLGNVFGQTGETLDGGGFFGTCMNLLETFRGTPVDFNQNAFVHDVTQLATEWGGELKMLGDELSELHPTCVADFDRMIHGHTGLTERGWTTKRDRYIQWGVIFTAIEDCLVKPTYLTRLRNLRPAIRHFTPHLAFCFSDEALGPPDTVPGDCWQHFNLLAVLARHLTGRTQPGDDDVQLHEEEGAEVACRRVAHASYELFDFDWIDAENRDGEFNVVAHQDYFTQHPPDDESSDESSDE